MSKDLWQSFKSTVRGFDSPHQLALGIALGLMIGLIPKDSVLPYALAALAILTSANLVCLGLSVLLASFISPHLDSITHEIGWWMLHHDQLVEIWSQLYQLPYLPWTRLNNTVVMGSTAIGLATVLPNYIASRLAISSLGPPARRLVARIPLARRFATTVSASVSPQLQES